MERIEILKLGAYCVKRMSLKAQQDLLTLAEKGLSFSSSVLSEFNQIEKGYDFVKACGGRLSLADFLDILTFCDQPTVDRIITDDAHKDSLLKSAEIEGYVITDNEAIYNTLDMDATMEWFKKVLGWPGNIDARDEAGNGTYGFIEPHFKASGLYNRSPYMQFWRGEPSKSVVGFAGVWGLNNLRQRIIEHGWEKVTPIDKKDWGASVFFLTTCDGSQLIFYEPYFWGTDLPKA